MAAQGLSFEGRVAIVTGAGGGLGRAHASYLAARGAAVVVNDLGSSLHGGARGSGPEPASVVADEIVAAGGNAVPDTNTVATPEGGRAIVDTALSAFGRIDIVVNNAGILHTAAFHNLDEAAVDALISVHLKGAFNVTKAAWPEFRKHSYGRVVNTTSTSGMVGHFGLSGYAAAKSGLLGLTTVLAAEGARSNIQVNAVAPVARTRMTEDLFGELATHLDPATVAPLVSWLCHEACPTTGEVFVAAGGHVGCVSTVISAGIHRTNLQMEDLRENWSEVCDVHSTYPMKEPGDEFAGLLRAIS